MKIQRNRLAYEGAQQGVTAEAVSENNAFNENYRNGDSRNEDAHSGRKRCGKIFCKKTICFFSGIVNILLLTVVVLLMSFAGYALWDSNQISQAADKSNYAIYKPTPENEGKSFKELQAINDEVIGWITVYGTNIDYPITQAENNMKYVNTSAEGTYSLSGAIFLDAENNGFDDFNSILYGHHMAARAMFGEIDEFAEQEKFDTHRYGNLYCDEKDCGIEFFAYLHVDAYDSSVFTANVGEDAAQRYLDNLLAKATHIREIDVTTHDRIILLSTCSSDSTNGRDILVGKITDETYEDTTLTADNKSSVTGTTIEHGAVKKIPLLLVLLITILAAMIIVRTFGFFHKRQLVKQYK